MLFREAQVGALLEISFAVILGSYAIARWWAQPMLGWAIAIVTAAATLGMLVSLTLNRLGIDPAVATGSFVTTAIDLIAILIYLSVCGTLLSL